VVKIKRPDDVPYLLSLIFPFQKSNALQVNWKRFIQTSFRTALTPYR